MSATLIQCKGIADIVVALILTVKPSIIYNSVITRSIHSLLGLVGFCIFFENTRTAPNFFVQKRISDASIAPGFNQSIACMVGAVGIGHVVGAHSGPALHPMICEYKTIKLKKKIPTVFYVSSCDEPFLGYSWVPHLRNTKSMGFRERYVADDKYQPCIV